MTNKKYIKKTGKNFQKIIICAVAMFMLTGCAEEDAISNISVNEVEAEIEDTDTSIEENDIEDTDDVELIVEEKPPINEEEAEGSVSPTLEAEGESAIAPTAEVLQEQEADRSPLAKTLEKIPTDTDIQAMSSEASGWGQGTQTDDLNRPSGCLQFQENYGSHAVRYIMDDSEEKYIYLTFDEGYENGYTPEILDVLKEKKVKAVFFITMDYAKKEPELVQRMIEEGHVVGNHSVTHPSAGIPSLSLEQQENEVMELHNYVKENFDYEMYLFRFPAGIFSEQSLGILDKCGYTGVFWSFAYHDWDPDNQMSYDEALKKTTDCIHPGAVYLLHAVSSTNTAILGEFIDTAIAQGYTFK